MLISSVGLTGNGLSAMQARKEARFFIYILFMAVLWMPLSGWFMPRILGVPTWAENPMWYITSAPLGVAIAYLFRWFIDEATGRRTRRVTQ